MVRTRPTATPTRRRSALPPGSRAVVALVGSSDRVRSFLNAVVEREGVTLQQYNVLRILRGAEPEGLPTLVVAQRMIERAPGITRMIDRLEGKGLVARERRGTDRRCVHCRITPAGLDLLAALDDTVDRADRAAFGALNQRELSELTSLLERVRDAHDAPAEAPDD